MRPLHHVRAQATLSALVERVRSRLPEDQLGYFADFVDRLGVRLAEQVAAALPSVTYFASGTNHPGEIRGFDALGQPIGVSAVEVGEDGLRALERAGVPLFVDSGAFGEKLQRPFGALTWERILGVYERLAGPGSRLVAPDKVGDQTESLRRLRRHWWRLLPLRALSATVIVPFQRGPLDLVELYDAVVGVVGDEDFVVGIPGNKVALSEEDLLPLLQGRRVRGVHILGMGPKNRRAPTLSAFLARHAPQASVSMDSNLRLAHLGQGRRLTAAEDEVQLELQEAERQGHPGLRGDGFGLPDYTDAIAFPNGWTGQRERRRIANEAIPRGQRASFVRDAELHLETHCAEGNADWCVELEASIEAAWSRYWSKATVSERKAEGIRRAFGGSR